MKNIFLNYGFYVIFAFIVFAFSAVVPSKFLALANLRNILIQAMPNIIIGTGLTMVIIMGGIDISVGSIAFIGASVAVELIDNDIMGIYPAFFIALVIGVVVGCINGLIITRLRVNPLITTLAMMFVLRGLGQYVINNSEIMIHDDRIYSLGAGYFGPIPTAIFWGGIVMIIGQIILSKTSFGRHLFAVGSNEKGAQISGLNVRRIKFFAYVICGFTAALGGLMWFSRSASVNPGLGQGAEFVVVTVVVLGGTSMAGGEGSIIPGSLFGALMLMTLEDGLILVGANPYLYPVVRGGVMLLAVFADSLRVKRRAFQGRRIRVTEVVVIGETG
ncbi:MAG: ABC transporter permease [Anaerolineaceae bacterium]|nr:ABC transporter permease [Anaerolineaceae bacterium]